MNADKPPYEKTTHISKNKKLGRGERLMIGWVEKKMIKLP